MTLYEYKSLETEEQFDHLWKQGQYLTQRSTIERRFAVYALHDFFVEIVYDRHSNSIVKHTSFIEGDILNKYANLGKLL
ncbi:hypothetical protein GCM10009117_08970 [Gangjinia marincola]|uniref:Uncharacterized protein n=1 Tax=Gangjinia marincola TaxID=578463 RepID=A0ABN1MFA4_9FLAO